MTPNFSLQRTAGLRFSRFVAQWPAAAEFRCSAHNMKLFANHFQLVHFYIFVGFVVTFTGLTFWGTIHQSPSDRRENNYMVATLLTFSGPFTGAIARPSQHTCLKNSLMLFRYCAAFLATGTLLQVVVFPLRRSADCLRITGWVIGLLGWFAGAVLSLLYAGS